VIRLWNDDHHVVESSQLFSEEFSAVDVGR